MRIDVEDDYRDDYYDDRPRRRYRKRDDDRPRRNPAKTCGCWILALIIIIALGYATVEFVIKPTVKNMDSPLEDIFAPRDSNQGGNDEPKDDESAYQSFDLFDPAGAEITMESSVEQAAVLEKLESLPEWMQDAFWDDFSQGLKDKVKDKVSDTVSKSIPVPDNFSIEGVKEVLGLIELTDSGKVSLSWEQLDKTKENLTAYYKDQLNEKGFGLQENISDYQIDLGFWKGDTFGIMSFKDGEDESESMVDIVINYFQ